MASDIDVGQSRTMDGNEEDQHEKPEFVEWTDNIPFANKLPGPGITILPLFSAYKKPEGRGHHGWSEPTASPKLHISRSRKLEPDQPDRRLWKTEMATILRKRWSSTIIDYCDLLAPEKQMCVYYILREDQQIPEGASGYHCSAEPLFVVSHWPDRTRSQPPVQDLAPRSDSTTRRLAAAG